MNTVCATCNNAYNGINGRYCRLLNHYVEYDKAPKCNNKTTTK